MSGYLDGLLVIFCLNLLLAYAVFLPVATGQLNLGGAAFQAIGAYATGYLCATYDIEVLPAVLISAALGGAFAFLFALLLLRTRSVYLVLATFAFAEFVSGVIVNIDALGGAMGLPVSPHVDSPAIALVTLATILAVLLVTQSRFGLAMRAIHDDDTVSELLGVGVRAVRVAAFAGGGILAGIAGSLHAFYFNFVDVQSFDAAASVYILLSVLLGGTQTIWGPIVGTAFFTLVPELFRNALAALPAMAGAFGGGGQVDTSWRFVLLGAVTVLMMVLRPEGLVTRVGLTRLRRRFASAAPGELPA